MIEQIGLVCVTATLDDVLTGCAVIHHGVIAGLGGFPTGETVNHGQCAVTATVQFIQRIGTLDRGRAGTQHQQTDTATQRSTATHTTGDGVKLHIHIARSGNLHLSGGIHLRVEQHRAGRIVGDQHVGTGTKGYIADRGRTRIAQRNQLVVGVDRQTAGPVRRRTQIQLAGSGFGDVLNDKHVHRARHGSATTTDADTVAKQTGHAVGLDTDCAGAGDLGAGLATALLGTQPGTHGTAVVTYRHTGTGANRATTGGIGTGRQAVDRICTHIEAANGQITASIDQRLGVAFKHQHSGTAGYTDNGTGSTDNNAAGRVGSTGINVHRTTAGDFGATHPCGNVATDHAGICGHSDRCSAKRKRRVEHTAEAVAMAGGTHADLLIRCSARIGLVDLRIINRRQCGATQYLGIAHTTNRGAGQWDQRYGRTDAGLTGLLQRCGSYRHPFDQL